MIKDEIVTIFGGTGFLGHVITQELARAGYRIKIVTRHPETAYDLKLYGAVGQICPVYCDFKADNAIEQAVQGSDYVVNLIGILFEKKKNAFKRTHTDIPEEIAKICTAQKIKKFIHISALGVEESKSKYAKTKLDGEQAVRVQYPAATILRPSVVFGAGDSFFNMFAKLATFFPALPLIGGGKTKFQPVYVGDIADAVVNLLNNKIDGKGKVFELGGPDIVTFKEIYEILLKETNRKRFLVPLPVPIAKIQATFMGLLPKPPLTVDQVKSLETDNVVGDNALTFNDLKITPTAMSVILPQYLSTYRRGGPFSEKQAG